MRKTCKLYIVVPCYNEQAVIEETTQRLVQKLTSLKSNRRILDSSRVIFINDGSEDDTWLKLVVLQKKNPTNVGVISLTKNCGHQSALLAGLMVARDESAVSISMDADLQDDINAMDRMLDDYYKGVDIVYGVRDKRTKDTFFKRLSAESFYRLMIIMGVELVFNHADYRLMSKRALDSLSQFKESNIFLRGIVPLIGYNSSEVVYERKKRFAGKSKYPLRRMFSFALGGITSFTVKPIRLVTILGVSVFTIGLVMLVYASVQHVAGETVAGWTSVLVSLWALGGAIMISLGIVGEYMGKIYIESKSRPRYIIDEIIID